MRDNFLQLDQSHVKVLGELKDGLIFLSSNYKVHQMIDIIVVDIPKAYGVILSRDWLTKLNRYFETDWSHLWLPYKGQPNKIKVECEHYMKHTVTDLHNTNEAVMFSNSIIGNLCFHTLFGELEAGSSPLANSDKQSKLLHTTQIVKPHCTIVYNCTKIDSNTCTDIVSSSTNFFVQLTDPHIWTLYSDGSKNKEEAGAGCLLIDPHINEMMLTCLLEFVCTNNVVEYEAVVQGLRKSLNLQVKCIEVFGDSQVFIQQVINSIHCTSNHLKNNQQEVWDLMYKFEYFNVRFISHSLNSKANMLANVASNLCPSNDFFS